MSTSIGSTSHSNYQKRWPALIALSLGVLMILLDATVVYVALPSIHQDLSFRASSVAWVVNAFTLAFGGTLLVGGRLGDHYGHREVFLTGAALFTIASLVCGLSQTPEVLILGRAAQGATGAVVAAVAQSLITNLFSDSAERAKAIGIYNCICVGGNSIGLLVGGLITTAMSWHWIFIVNLPIGISVCVLCWLYLPRVRVLDIDTQLDVWGTVAVTTSLVLAAYAISNGNHAGWRSAQTLGLLTCAALAMAVFLRIEARARTPLLPLSYFRRRTIVLATIVRFLWSAGESAMLFISLYLQLVLGYRPFEIGITFLPGSIIMAAFSLILSAKLAVRYGIRKPLSVGMLLGAFALTWLARAPVDGHAAVDVLPGTILLAFSVGIASIPILLASMDGVEPRESGLASGVLNTAALMGSTLGLAVLVSVSAARTGDLLASGAADLVALTSGYSSAFLAGAACIGVGALISAVFLPTKLSSPTLEISAKEKSVSDQKVDQTH